MIALLAVLSAISSYSSTTSHPLRLTSLHLDIQIPRQLSNPAKSADTLQDIMSPGGKSLAKSWPGAVLPTILVSALYIACIRHAELVERDPHPRPLQNVSGHKEQESKEMCIS